MPYYELFRGSQRLKMPLREGEPTNRADRRNYRWYDDEDEARRDGLRKEHKRFGHDSPRRGCPMCGDARDEGGE